MSYLSKFVVALVVVLSMAILASRQLFLFAVFNDSLALQGDRAHLWLAVSAAAGACIAGALMFHYFLRYEKTKSSQVTTSSTGPQFNDVVPIPSLVPPVTRTFAPVRRELASQWLTEGQADDRTPMDGSVAESARPASAQRAFARGTHQLMFKKWSQGRHE